MAKIILVEDDKELAFMVKRSLLIEHDLVETYHNGQDAEHALKMSEYDLVILDWDLPALSGIELLKKLRGAGKRIPIIMITGKSSLQEKETGFDVGADDYLTKPFLPRELLLRVRAILRRSGGYAGDTISCGRLTVELKTHGVTIDGEAVNLSKKEFQVLELLMRHPGEVFSPEVVLQRVWPSDTEVSLEAARYTIKQLRKKLTRGELECPIQNVHGVGYRVATEPQGA